MASSTTGGVQNPISSSSSRRALGFVANAIKHKHSFAQFVAMTGILLLSCRSLGQKYRIHDLTEDTAVLEEEQASLVARMSMIKQRLLDEAKAEPTGAFAARLRVLFGDESA